MTFLQKKISFAELYIFAMLFAFYACFAFGFKAVDPFIIRKMSNAAAPAQGTC